MKQGLNISKDNVNRNSNNLTTIYYTKSVYKNSFDPNAPTAEDLCENHKWRHRSSKYFRNPLPKNWVYCPSCRTEKLL